MFAVAGASGRPVAPPVHRAHATSPDGGRVPLFAYGALQRRPVQEALLGRALEGTPDRLPGFALTLAELTGGALVAATGSGLHPMAVLGADAGGSVPGTLYALAAADLDVLDRGRDTRFHRVELTLASGGTAWVFVDRRYRPPLRGPRRVPSRRLPLTSHG